VGVFRRFAANEQRFARGGARNERRFARGGKTALA
jgi:hypothetical protein